MKTIASCVQDIIVSSPFLEEGLSRHIINFSALAKDLNAPISEMLRKPVKDGAIMMALRRHQHPLNLENSRNSFDALMHTVCEPTSSLHVLHIPSR